MIIIVKNDRVTRRRSCEWFNLFIYVAVLCCCCWDDAWPRDRVQDWLNNNNNNVNSVFFWILGADRLPVVQRTNYSRTMSILCSIQWKILDYFVFQWNGRYRFRTFSLIPVLDVCMCLSHLWHSHTHNILSLRVRCRFGFHFIYILDKK